MSVLLTSCRLKDIFVKLVWVTYIQFRAKHWSPQLLQYVLLRVVFTSRIVVWHCIRRLAPSAKQCLHDRIQSHISTCPSGVVGKHVTMATTSESSIARWSQAASMSYCMPWPGGKVLLFFSPLNAENVSQKSLFRIILWCNQQFN